MSKFLSNLKGKMPKLKRSSKTDEHDDDAETEHDITPPIAEASRASQVMEEEVIDFTDAAKASSPVQEKAPAIIVPTPIEEPKRPEMRPTTGRSSRRGGSSRISQQITSMIDSIFPPQPTIEELDYLETKGEIDAYSAFQQNLARSRNVYRPYYSAPGFDYVNWKPYGTYRNHNNPREFQQQARALSDYVYSVVVSGCTGAEEKRWVTLTTSPEQHSAFMEASRAASQSASREQLAS